MAINKAMRIALKALSYPDLDVKKNYKLHRQVKTVVNPYLKPRYTIWDHKIAGIDHEIPVRVFLPPETPEDEPHRLLIFFHGGGWVTGNIDSDETGFLSIRKYGQDYLLTSKRIRDYMDMYIGSEKDLNNPYLAPLIAENLSNQPNTLIITAEYDPLRDEGEAYGKKLIDHGNQVKIYRMKDALHGFFALPKHFIHIKRSYEMINKFLKNEEDR